MSLHRRPEFERKHMKTIGNVLVGVVALLHGYFLVLEMFFWTKPLGLKVFGMTQEVADASKVLAMNQGLYNGFLAAGLVWGLINRDFGRQIKIFFLTCVLIAGIFGAATAGIKILFVQGLPAAIGLALVCLSAE